MTTQLINKVFTTMCQYRLQPKINLIQQMLPLIIKIIQYLIQLSKRLFRVLIKYLTKKFNKKLFLTSSFKQI